VADKKVAVVVVHGVADQQPSDSARQIADLLTHLCPFGTYSTFQEEKIRIPLEPVIKPGDESIGPVKPGGSPFEERNDDARRRHDGEPPDVDPEIGFMVDQLRDYKASEQPRVFETVRLDGVRNDEGCSVHVYEAYWADLSRLTQGIVAFFGELYQLLLHLPSLGRNTVDYARAENGNKGLWPLFSWTHRWSVRWLTLFIVVLNLVLASLVLPALAPRLTRPPAPSKEAPAKYGQIAGCCRLPSVTPEPPKKEEGASVIDVVTQAVLALALIGATALLLRHRRLPWWFLWAVAPVIAAAVGVFLAYTIAVLWGAGRLLVFEAWGVSAALIAALLVRYETMRPGAKWVGWPLLGAMSVALFIFLDGGDGSELALTTAVLYVVEIVNVVLQLVWRLHVVWLLLTVVIGLLCWATASREWRHRAWNTAWTARVTLTLSTALFANLTLAIWAALFAGVKNVLPAGDFTPLRMGVVLDRLLCLNPSTVQPAEWVKNALTVSASRAFIYITIAFAVFVIAAIWSILPSVIVETKQPEQTKEPTRMRALGVWLTRGLNFIPFAAELFGALLVGVVYLACRQVVDCKPPADSSWTAISAAAALLAALIAARFWLPGASAALDVMLDVDNYLRHHPKKSTPRARIAERFASLFRFLLNEKQCKHDYDAIVIIAHSQGSIITADLLRFLKWKDKPLSDALMAKNLALFTMGNPLRQLYKRAFPGLYPWVWPATGPAPGDIGVCQWINAYRSGDYVGRIITGDFDEPRWNRRVQDPQNKGLPTVTSANGIDEMCIGEGAHLHYWDQHGEDIAVQLDALIAERCGGNP
jgi:hypothetical protein